MFRCFGLQECIVCFARVYPLTLDSAEASIVGECSKILVPKVSPATICATQRVSLDCSEDTSS